MKFFSLLFIITTHLFSIETVLILKTGENLKIEMIEENEISIFFKNLENGTVDIISKEDIKKIIYFQTNDENDFFLKTKSLKKPRKKKATENPRTQLDLEIEIARGKVFPMYF